MAVKVQNLKEISINEKDISEEYRILRDLSSHPNLPSFFGTFLNKNGVELWFVMEVRHDAEIIRLWFYCTIWFCRTRQCGYPIGLNDFVLEANINCSKTKLDQLISELWWIKTSKKK